MKEIIVEGGSPLRGDITVQGAKNALLPILAASILTQDEIELTNCPHLSDAVCMLAMLRDLGCRTEETDGTIRVCARDLAEMPLKDALTCRLRSSIFILGPLAARLSHATLGYPGGCDIGLRPIDLHIKGLRALGVTVTEEEGHIHASCTRLRGAEVYLDYPSVGATENVMMASALAEGETVIHNAAKEPEIVDLQNFLNQMGGRVAGAGTGHITVQGVKKLHGCRYEIMPDRIATGTWMIASVLTKGDIYLRNAIGEHVAALTNKLRDGGAEIKKDGDGLRVRMHKRFRAGGMVETMPYPGFPTDLQSPMMTLLSVADGTGMLMENVFENRLRLAGELKKMGADITVRERLAIIKGVQKLKGAQVHTFDLRGGAALVLAGLAAEDETRITDDHLIERGYDRLEETLCALGARVRVRE